MGAVVVDQRVVLGVDQQVHPAPAEGPDAVLHRLQQRRADALGALGGPDLTWLADATLFGTRKDVLEGVEAWFAAGVKTPILVPSSTKGGQARAFEEIFAAFA